jgi:hypothetical protein
MDDKVMAGDSPPNRFAVFVVAGVCTGVVPAILGMVVGLVGGPLNLCQQFGDFGCAGYAFMGFYASPLSALGGAVVGSLAAARMAREHHRLDRVRIWMRSLGFALLSLPLMAPLSVTLMDFLMNRR